MIRIRDTNQKRREKTEMAKQIKFIDLENQKIHGGIEMDDGNVICGCCGGLQEKTEDGVTRKKLETYSNWIDLTEEICGDDFEE